MSYDPNANAYTNVTLDPRYRITSVTHPKYYWKWDLVGDGSYAVMTKKNVCWFHRFMWTVFFGSKWSRV